MYERRDIFKGDLSFLLDEVSALRLQDLNKLRIIVLVCIPAQITSSNCISREACHSRLYVWMQVK